MTLELGVYSFGNTPRTPDGGYGPTAQAVRDVLEAVRLAEDVGLDFFGFGEHHTRSMPLSSPTSLVTAAAASTQRIKLGTTVTVLSTDEPLRGFQQLATAAAIAPGRIEAVAGRGSSAITFPLFDLDEGDYDLLYASKLELLLAVNQHEQVTWSGPHRRRPLQDALIVPRPEQPLRIWLGSGGSPESVDRAVELGVPLFLGILGGSPEHWAQYGRAYRQAWAQLGHPADAADIAVAVHGFVGTDHRQAKATYLDHQLRMFAPRAAEVGRPPIGPPGRSPSSSPAGWSSPADRTRSPTASCTCTACSATPARSCRWTSAACRTPPTSRPSSCSAPRCCHRSARSSADRPAPHRYPAPRQSRRLVAPRRPPDHLPGEPHVHRSCHHHRPARPHLPELRGDEAPRERAGRRRHRRHRRRPCPLLPGPRGPGNRRRGGHRHRAVGRAPRHRRRYRPRRLLRRRRRGPPA